MYIIWDACQNGITVPRGVLFFLLFFCEIFLYPLGVSWEKKIQIRSLSSVKPLYSGFTVIGPALISHPVRALIRAKPVAWGFSLHKGGSRAIIMR